MDGATTAAFVALALCVPLIALVFGFRLLAMWSFVERRFTGKNREKPPKPPPGRSPYHLP